MNKIDETRQYMRNPELIRVKLEERLKEYAEGTEAYKQLKAKLDSYRTRIDALVAEQATDVRSLETRLTETFVEEYRMIIEERVGLIPNTKIQMMERLLLVDGK